MTAVDLPDAATLEAAVHRWLADPTAGLAQDARQLAARVAEGERLLATLPPVPRRDGAQRALAARVHAAARVARRVFLGRHTESAYRALTADLTRAIRLPELIRAAAETFPGLVPDAEQLAKEVGRAQAEREGREIDQGLFCGAVLANPVAGRHLVETMLRPTDAALALLPGFRATGRADLDTVRVRRRGPAAHVEFRNTTRLNSEDVTLIADLDVAVDLALLDDQVRVGVLRGGRVAHSKYRGRRVFSAGINLDDLRAGRIPLVEFLLGRELGYVHKLLRGIRTGAAGAWADRSIAKPWIGAVDAFAIGGGMQLLLVLDTVIAERDAWFSLPAAAEGIVPGLGNLRLTRATGARLARQVILGGRRIAATDPEARLVCDEVVDPAGMDAAIERAVTALAAPAVTANRRMLTLAEEPPDLFREYLAEFAVVQPVRAHSADVLAKLARRAGAA